MNIEEKLNWMCKEITFWYMEIYGKREIIYPLTNEKQKIVQNILNEESDIIIYKNKFYFLEKDIEKTINKTSYIYYMREATAYKKRKAISILPYSLRDKKVTIVEKMMVYYRKNNLPFLSIVINNFDCLKSGFINTLNPFTYINLSSDRLVRHKDIYLNNGDKLFVLMSDINSKKLLKKFFKLKKILKKEAQEKSKCILIDDDDMVIKFLSTTSID